jgi:hypothetical protein
MEQLFFDGISGAITEPLSPEARRHAKIFYEEIRLRRSDVKKIAEHTQHPEADIEKIKEYLFVDVHELADGTRRFDPNFEIAMSWQRLADDPRHIQEHDRILISHELLEMKLVANGMTQEDAHSRASGIYDYGKASNDFYNGLRNKGNGRPGKTDITQCADKDDWDIQK